MMIRILLIVCLLMLRVTAAHADAPGFWIQHYKESMGAVGEAFNKKLADKVKEAENNLKMKGCLNREGSDCERYRAKYLAASMQYLDNAAAYLDKALSAASLAKQGYKRDGKTIRSIEYVKSTVRDAHNDVAKTYYLSDLAAFYDPNARRVISGQALNSLGNFVMGLDKEVESFSQNRQFNVTEWELFVKTIFKGVKVRKALLRETAVLGAYRAQSLLLCLNSGGAVESCRTDEIKNFPEQLFAPLGGMNSVVNSMTISDTANDDSRITPDIVEHFKKFK